MWCLNNSLLRDDSYKYRIKEYLRAMIDNLGVTEDVGRWWEHIKEGIKKISIKYAKHKKMHKMRKEREIKQMIDAELERADNDADWKIDKLLKLRNSLYKYEMEEA